ncbi:carboxylating nicotinate-nucleotide diphosphorylase [Oceanispirochaeta crateris]|uniref:Probable nicotinate-nucleotide pyrophosphorylase [carboxylating] n=1 Tax=Oceanispirochaeta crateris TaxID=2518645 RepID=A0A5C1QKN2_9SPIO|nr:carboxylating nicotinate-nucleotide diphosphorylase [Oceanispirochaeta crateris]QEN07759.1 carboxylating nicotinate-nucleotide diphosphorylase [Oceanispirochaeta crateris]
MNDENFNNLLKLALNEDLHDSGDITSRAIFDDNQITTAVLKSKDTGILAGISFFSQVFVKVDSRIVVRKKMDDGSSLKPGDIVATVTGPVAAVLEAERTAINFLSFLSGIASCTAQHIKTAQENGHVVILDTRKTLPGYRSLSKYAVKMGGGQNHRMGLYDMIMIKDNHIDAAGSISSAVTRVRDKWGDHYRIEVECRTLEEVKEALDCRVDVIMLDNMSPEMTSEAVSMRQGHVEFEASGNMDLEKIKKYNNTGVDYISIGKLTHSVKAFDFSLVME